MEHNAQMLKLMEQMEANSRKQSRLALVQCVFSVIAAVCGIVLLIAALRFAPQMQLITDQVQSLTTQAQTIAVQAQDVLTDLQTVTDELTQVDLAGMVSNVDSLVTSSQEAVTQATEKLEAIDIDALNSAIADLSSVVGPLADLVENLSFF